MTITLADFAPLIDSITDVAPVLLQVNLAIIGVTAVLAFLSRRARSAVR